MSELKLREFKLPTFSSRTRAWMWGHLARVSPHHAAHLGTCHLASGSCWFPFCFPFFPSLFPFLISFFPFLSVNCITDKCCGKQFIKPKRVQTVNKTWKSLHPGCQQSLFSHLLLGWCTRTRDTYQDGTHSSALMGHTVLPCSFWQVHDLFHSIDTLIYAAIPVEYPFESWLLVFPLCCCLCNFA